MTDESDICAAAHGERTEPGTDRALVAVFDSPVARYLLRYARDVGFRVALVEPDAERAGEVDGAALPVTSAVTGLDANTDVVVTDHHRGELGTVLRDVLASPVRWVGVLGNPRHEGPHVAALRELEVPQAEIDRVHRPIGLNIGSRTPPEIAVATIAGLLADRNGTDAGFLRRREAHT